jgi:hypothetical protein
MKSQHQSGFSERLQIGKHFANTVTHLKLRRDANDGTTDAYNKLALP